MVLNSSVGQVDLLFFALSLFFCLVALLREYVVFCICLRWWGKMLDQAGRFNPAELFTAWFGPFCGEDNLHCYSYPDDGEKLCRMEAN